MKTYNRVVSIIGHLLLIITWIICFVINSYHYDSGADVPLLLFAMHLLLTFVGLLMIVLKSHKDILLRENHESLFSIQVLLLAIGLCIISVMLVNNRTNGIVEKILNPEKKLDIAALYASSFLFLVSGIFAIDYRSRYINNKLLVVSCIALLGIYALIKYS